MTGANVHVVREDHEGGDAQVCPAHAEDLCDLVDRAYKKEGRISYLVGGQWGSQLGGTGYQLSAISLFSSFPTSDFRPPTRLTRVLECGDKNLYFHN